MTDYTLNLYAHLTDAPDRIPFTATSPALGRTPDGWIVHDEERLIMIALDADYTAATINPVGPLAGPGVLNSPDPHRKFGLLLGADGRFHQAPPIADPIHWEGTPLEHLRQVAPGKFVTVNINNPDPKPTEDQATDARELDVLMGACGVDRQKAALKSLLADVKSLTEPTWLDADALEELPTDSLILVCGEKIPRCLNGNGWWSDLRGATVPLDSAQAAPAVLLWTPEGDK